MDTQTAVAKPTKRRVSPARFRIVSIIVIMVATLSVAFSLLQVVTIVTGHALLTTGGSDGGLPLATLPQLLQADLREGATGSLADAALSLRLLCASPFLIQAILFTTASVALLRIIERVSAAEPFGAPVLKNWRLLTIALLGGGVLQGILDTVANIYLASNIGLLFGAGQVTHEQASRFLGGDYEAIGTNFPQWPLAIIIAGLAAFALSSAFRMGAQLERDVDGVI